MSTFLLGMLAGAGVALVANQSLQRAAPLELKTDSVRASQSHSEEAQPVAAIERASAVPGAMRGDPPEAAPAAPTDAQWNALVAGMLEWEVDRDSGERLSAAQRHRLVSELARLREASLALQEMPAAPDDPAELRERLARTLTLAQVDEAFREELGIGVAEFVRQQDRDAVQDVASIPQR